MGKKRLEELEKKFIRKDLSKNRKPVWGELKTPFASVKIVDLKSLRCAEDIMEVLKSGLEESED